MKWKGVYNWESEVIKNEKGIRWRRTGPSHFECQAQLAREHQRLNLDQET